MEGQGNEHVFPFGNIFGEILLNDPSISSNSSSRILPIKCEEERTSEKGKSEINDICHSLVELCHIEVQSDDCGINFVFKEEEATYCNVENADDPLCQDPLLLTELDYENFTKREEQNFKTDSKDINKTSSHIKDLRIVLERIDTSSFIRPVIKRENAENNSFNELILARGEDGSNCSNKKRTHLVNCTGGISRSKINMSITKDVSIVLQRIDFHPLLKQLMIPGESSKLSSASLLSDNKNRYGRDEGSCPKVITVPSSKEKSSGHGDHVGQNKDEVMAENGDPVSQVHECNVYPSRSENESNSKSRGEIIICRSCMQNKHHNQASDVLAVPEGEGNGNCQCRSTDKRNKKMPITRQVGCTSQDYSFKKDRSAVDGKLKSSTRVKQFVCAYCDFKCAAKNNLKSHILTHTGDKQFLCSYCEYRCYTKGNLKCHMLTHTGAKPFHCSCCEYKCTQKHNLKSHMLTHTGVKPFHCSRCEYRCCTKAGLKRHMFTHTADKPFQCSYCEYRCCVKGDLAIHMLTHTGDKRFRCSQCEYSCFQKGRLKYHILTHTGVKPIHCLRCEYRCYRKGDLKRHMFTHTADKPLQCSDCEYRCTKKRSLELHVLTHTADKPDKPFHCFHCEYRCYSKGRINRHMLIHDKPFQCSHCEYRCGEKRRLQEHILTHTGVKPFQCSHCEYRCYVERSLKRHMATHTGVKPFQCHQCESKFYEKRDLKRHMMSHTADKPFHCSYCEFRCSRKGNLTVHMFTHTGIKRFQCSECEQRFSQKAALKRHVLTHTGIKPFQC